MIQLFTSRFVLNTYRKGLPSVLSWSEVDVLGSELATCHKYRSKDHQITVRLEHPLLKKSNSLSSPGGVIIDEVRGRMQVMEALHRLD